MRVREVHVTEKGREAFRRFWPEMHAAFASDVRRHLGGANTKH